MVHKPHIEFTELSATQHALLWATQPDDLCCILGFLPAGRAAAADDTVRVAAAVAEPMARGRELRWRAGSAQCGSTHSPPGKHQLLQDLPLFPFLGNPVPAALMFYTIILCCLWAPAVRPSHPRASPVSLTITSGVHQEENCTAG